MIRNERAGLNRDHHYRAGRAQRPGHGSSPSPRAVCGAAVLVVGRRRAARRGRGVVLRRRRARAQRPLGRLAAARRLA
eukprot:2905168-Prymnesium_polylepis.1